MRTVLRIGTAGALVVCVLGIGQGTAAADQGCTGTAASTAAKALQPFGQVVSQTTKLFDNFGQDVIRPEATAPRDACPPPPTPPSP